MKIKVRPNHGLECVRVEVRFKFGRSPWMYVTFVR